MRKIGLLVIGLSLLLAACQFELTTDLYIQDIVDVRELGEAIYSNATLALEFSGDDEDKAEVTALLEDFLLEVSNIREEDRNYSTYLLVDYKLPLVYAEDVGTVYSLPEVRDNMFTFAVTPGALNVAFNRSRFDELDAALYDQFYRNLTFEDFTMKLYLRNDLRDAVDVTLYSLYANNEPIPYSATITLERRDEIEIRFSDVLRDSALTPGPTETDGITVRKFADLDVAAQ